MADASYYYRSDARGNQPRDKSAFDSAIKAFHADVALAGSLGTIDGAARATYDREIRRMADQLAREARAGRMTWRAAAKEASGVRNEVMELIRTRSTPVGRALAEQMKGTGKTLNEMIARKTAQMFGEGADFTKLSTKQQNAVYAEIVKSAGKSNPKVTGRMRTVSRFGRALIVLSIGVSVYNIAVAEDKGEAATREVAVTGAGIAGGAAGGALAGLACGPGAPVCVTVGAFVGGALAAFGVDWAFF